jgi:hypothetical protein
MMDAQDIREESKLWAKASNAANMENRYNHWQKMIAEQLRLAAKLVEQHDPGTGLRNWAYVGDLAHTSELLDKVIQHHSGNEDYNHEEDRHADLELEEPEHDVVRVFFDDDTSTVINVLVDDDIPDAIVKLCEDQGYSTRSVTDFKIEE